MILVNKIKILTITGILLLLSQFMQCQNPVNNREQEGKHLFILSGQSNMAGLDPDLSFTPAVSAEFGLENIIVVKYAVGGTSIQRWYKEWEYPDGLQENNDGDSIGQSNQTQGDLYEILMDKVNDALAGKKIKTVTLVWMQGERDARLGYAEVYEEALMGLYNSVSSDLDKEGIYFIIGRLSDWDERIKYPDWQKIREIQVKVAKSSPLFDCINTDDLNNLKGGTNDLHYTKEGYKIFGERIAQKAIKLINRHPFGK